MIKPVVLENRSKTGKLLKAAFLPLQGMNLISFCKDNIEIIDQSTAALFEERYAGLGAMIGPHFYHRKELPLLPSTSHIPYLTKAFTKGMKEPFSHGIGRYVPWNYQSSSTHISASLCGSDKWFHIPLRDLEGFDFEMKYDATLHPTGLSLKLSVKAEKPSIIGLHTYYKIDNHSFLSSQVQPIYNDMGEFKPIEPRFLSEDKSHLHLNLSHEIDAGFLPIKQTEGSALLETSFHSVFIQFTSTQDLSLQVYHPKDASFACIEPLSAKNPRDLTALSSSIEIAIELLP